VHVSLPQITTSATPTKTAMGMGTILGKFSTLFAEAQDAADPSIPETKNQDSTRIAKKVSAKIDKSSDKAADVKSRSTVPATTPATSPSHGNNAAMTMVARGSVAPQNEVPQADDSESQAGGIATTKVDSDSLRTFPPQFGLIDSGSVANPTGKTKATGDAATLAAVPVQPAAKRVEAPSPSSDKQPEIASSTNSLSAWTPRTQGTSFASTVPAAADSQAPAPPNGKPANVGTKAASRDTAQGTISILDTKTQTGFTSLQSHAASSATPVPAVQPSPNSNSETKHEVPKGHSLSEGSTGKQEKAVTRTSSETHNQDSGNARDEATQFGNEKSLSSAAALASSSNSEATVAAPGSVVSTQISAVAVNSHTANNAAFSKTGDALPHTQSSAATEAAEAAKEVIESSPSSPLHTAKLVAGLERSELHMGLRTGDFGKVDIRTSLGRNQFSAEISVERGELSRALAAELPALQHRLNEQHLPTASITVQEHSAGGSSEFHQGSRQGQSGASAGISGSSEDGESLLPAFAQDGMEATARLDIHM
jgi:hypothetical protein